MAVDDMWHKHCYKLRMYCYSPFMMQSNRDIEFDQRTAGIVGLYEDSWHCGHPMNGIIVMCPTVSLIQHGGFHNRSACFSSPATDLGRIPASCLKECPSIGRGTS
jgi:hypothetical protein